MTNIGNNNNIGKRKATPTSAFGTTQGNNPPVRNVRQRQESILQTNTVQYSAQPLSEAINVFASSGEWQKYLSKEEKNALNKMMQTSDTTTTNSVAYAQSEQRFISVDDLSTIINNDKNGDHIVIGHGNGKLCQNKGLNKLKTFMQNNLRLFATNIFIGFIEEFPQSRFYTQKNSKVYDEGFREIDLNKKEDKSYLCRKINRIKHCLPKNHKNLDAKPPAI